MQPTLPTEKRRHNYSHKQKHKAFTSLRLQQASQPAKEQTCTGYVATHALGWPADLRSASEFSACGIVVQVPSALKRQP